MAHRESQCNGEAMSHAAPMLRCFTIAAMSLTKIPQLEGESRALSQCNGEAMSHAAPMLRCYTIAAMSLTKIPRLEGESHALSLTKFPAARGKMSHAPPQLFCMVPPVDPGPLNDPWREAVSPKQQVIVITTFNGLPSVIHLVLVYHHARVFVQA